MIKLLQHSKAKRSDDEKQGLTPFFESEKEKENKGDNRPQKGQANRRGARIWGMIGSLVQAHPTLISHALGCSLLIGLTVHAVQLLLVHYVSPVIAGWALASMVDAGGAPGLVIAGAALVLGLVVQGCKWMSNAHAADPMDHPSQQRRLGR